MGGKKDKKRQRKEARRDPTNPEILTLDQALALAEQTTKGDASKRGDAARRTVSAIMDRIRSRFTGPSNFDRLTGGERLVHTVYWLQAEVLNGGFHQYLTNSTGDDAEDAKRYLKQLGAKQTLTLMKRLSEIFPKGAIPQDPEARDTVLSEWEEENSENNLFDQLSLSFYRQDESLDHLMLEYVRGHRAEFAEPNDEILRKLRTSERIKQHFCGTSRPEWLDGAEQALAALEALVKSQKTKSKQE